MTMKNFLKNIFGKNNKEGNKASTEQLTEAQILELLSRAISNVGYWTWWITELPTLVQIEFGGTQLYFPPDDHSQPPNTRIAIQFGKPKSISFLTKKALTREEENWFDELHADKMEPPTCSYGAFSFTDPSLIAEIISSATTIKTVHGYAPTDAMFLTEKYKLAFWAGDYGFAVSSDEFKLITSIGVVALDQISSVHSEWWAYWRRYWDLKNTPDALPEDYACEVTIPIKNN